MKYGQISTFVKKDLKKKIRFFTLNSGSSQFVPFFYDVGNMTQRVIFVKEGKKKRERIIQVEALRMSALFLRSYVSQKLKIITFYLITLAHIYARIIRRYLPRATVNEIVQPANQPDYQERTNCNNQVGESVSNYAGD